MAAFIIENSGGRKVWVDIAMPATWNGDRSEVAVTDLDMDVERLGGAAPVLLDVDEFEEARLARGYPESVVRAARKSAQDLFERVRDHVEPFDTIGWRWLEAAVDNPA